MRRAQIIKDSLYDYLSEKGYSYIADKDTWVFRKEEVEIRKEIVIHDIYKTSVRFDFATTVGRKKGMLYMDKSKIRLNNQGFCEYQNEEEFQIIVEEIKRVIISKGEEIFNEISVISEEQRLTWEMEKELFDNHEQLIEKGKIFFGIENETGEEKIDMIIAKLKSIKGKSLQEVREELLMLSAVYGQMYEEKFEGKWVYYNRYCGVDCISNNTLFPMLSLELDIDETYKLMINKYQYTLNEYNRFLNQRKK